MHNTMKDQSPAIVSKTSTNFKDYQSQVPSRKHKQQRCYKAVELL